MSANFDMAELLSIGIAMMVKQKILIVDDDRNIAEQISLYLVKECFEIKIVEDGKEAIEAFMEFQPDFISVVSTEGVGTEFMFSLPKVM